VGRNVVILKRTTFPKLLLLLAAFVFFSANTVYFLEGSDGVLLAASNAAPAPTYNLEYGKERPKAPRLNLKSAIVVNHDNGEVLYAKDPESVRPIASISKLVTAMVVLDKHVSLDSVMTITKEDVKQSSRSRLRVGYQMSVRDLMHAALMNSDNRAARALARAACGTYDAFAKEMNNKVKALGLKHSHFVEPTGLSAENVSTAHEVAIILHHAYNYEWIAKITSRESYRCTVQFRKRRLALNFTNTNVLLHSKFDVLSGKTGYINESDYCLTTLVQNGKGKKLTIVVLGCPGNKLRFKEARQLAEWGFKNI
jgi:serine-type D-Ala-D-Ala endopeptidase (penicillin-binding protein 7)